MSYHPILHIWIISSSSVDTAIIHRQLVAMIRVHLRLVYNNTDKENNHVMIGLWLSDLVFFKQTARRAWKNDLLLNDKYNCRFVNLIAFILLLLLDKLNYSVQIIECSW